MSPALKVPVTVRLLNVVLPVAFNVPLTLAPVPVTTKMFALPATLVVTLPLTPTISTLLVPFAIEETPMSPAWSVPVTVKLLKVVLPVMLALPVTLKFALA